MPIRIGMRSSDNRSFFQSFVSSLIKAVPVGDADNKLVLAGPYWDEGILDSTEPSFQQLILDHCREVELVFGNRNFANQRLFDKNGKPRPTSFESYARFYKRLNSYVNGDVIVDPRAFKGRMMHSKLTLRLRGGKVIGGVLGSSNYTMPAWNEWKKSKSENKEELLLGNCETDVLLWDDEDLTEHFLTDPGEWPKTEGKMMSNGPQDDSRPPTMNIFAQELSREELPRGVTNRSKLSSKREGSLCDQLTQQYNWLKKHSETISNQLASTTLELDPYRNS